MNTAVRLGTVLMACAIGALPLPAQNPSWQRQDLKFIGTWKLNLSKSSFITGPAPKTVNVHTWWWEGDTLKHKVAVLNDKGEVVRVGGQWSANFDAKDHLSGGEGESKISLTILDARHTEMTEGVPGTPLSHFQQAVSEDGSTLTITRKIDGKDGADTMVHDRVPAAESQFGSSPTSAAAGELQRMGRIVYLQNCSFCHYPKNQNPKSTAPGKTLGPELQGLFRRDQPVGEQAVRAVILSGVPQKMPAFRYGLTPEEMDELIAYLRTL